MCSLQVLRKRDVTNKRHLLHGNGYHMTYMYVCIFIYIHTYIHIYIHRDVTDKRHPLHGNGYLWHVSHHRTHMSHHHVTNKRHLLHGNGYHMTVAVLNAPSARVTQGVLINDTLSHEEKTPASWKWTQENCLLVRAPHVYTCAYIIDEAWQEYDLYIYNLYNLRVKRHLLHGNGPKGIVSSFARLATSIVPASCTCVCVCVCVYVCMCVCARARMVDQNLSMPFERTKKRDLNALLNRPRLFTTPCTQYTAHTPYMTHNTVLHSHFLTSSWPIFWV